MRFWFCKQQRQKIKCLWNNSKTNRWLSWWFCLNTYSCAIYIVFNITYSQHLRLKGERLKMMNDFNEFANNLLLVETLISSSFFLATRLQYIVFQILFITFRKTYQPHPYFPLPTVVMLQFTALKSSQTTKSFNHLFKYFDKKSSSKFSNLKYVVWKEWMPLKSFHLSSKSLMIVSWRHFAKNPSG